MSHNFETTLTLLLYLEFIPSTMPKKGHRRKKKRTHANDDANEAAQSALTSKKDEKIPKSLVMRRGRCAGEVAELITDVRHMMLPFTALNFQEDPKNRKLSLSQYASSLALPMGISHILSFSQNEDRLNLRLARTPEGPTLSFRVHKFSLNRHIKSLQKRPVSYTAALQTNPPVVVTNNFGDGSAAPHVKLLRITFQNMFPAINVATIKLVECRRVVLFNLTEEVGEAGSKQIVEMRHYAVKATPVGVNKRVRRLIQAKIPNLSKCNDVADYLEGNGFVSDAPSDSEAEDAPEVTLPDRFAGRGNNKSQKSALKLVEIGPRMSMELIKVEKGLGGGDVLYHALVNKTPEEAAALKAKKQQEHALKEGRRATQEANVDRKRKAEDEKRAMKRQRKQEKEEARMHSLREGGLSDAEEASNDESNSEASDEDVPIK